jgi:uncharacterized repeat protein (TIGR02543 family)
MDSLRASPMVDPNTPPGVMPVSGGTAWQLDFSDEFSGTTLNTSKWGIDVSSKSRAARSDRGINDWWWKSQNVSLDGAGNLKLDVVKFDSDTMHCGSVSSDGKYDPTYGYIEARVKIADTTKDTHTAFWLQGANQDNVDGTGNDGAEVDIFESAWTGNYTKSVVHIDGYGASHKSSTKQYTAPGLHSGYHVFGLEWTANSMNIYYDGVLKATYTGIWVPQVPEWLWLSVGASFGDIGTFQTEPNGYLTSAYFDYVRVWKPITASFTVTYNGNGHTGGSTPPNQTKPQGVSLTLAQNTGNLVKTGYAFSGWNTQANGMGTSYPAGGTFTTDANTTLYAEWNQPPVINAGVDKTTALSGTIAWNPSHTTTALWLDADDANTLALSGNTVSQWNDKSGNNRHATASGTAQPTATENGLNNKRVLTFDGVSDVLNVNLDFLANTSHSAFIVLADPSAYSNIYGAANGSGGANSLHVGFNGSNKYRINYWGHDYAPTVTGNFVSTGSIMNYVWPLGSPKQIFANGKLEGSGHNALAPGTMSGGGRIGRVTGHPYLGAKLGEIIICTGTLGQADREKFEGYLAHKWGLPANLPASHPHKSNFPTTAGASITLEGSASDPEGATPSVSWSMVSGPDTVTFGNASSPITTATFQAAGIYTLRLTASDGVSQLSDDILVTVNPASAYTNWSAGSFARPFSVTGMSGNPDGDAFTNLQEFAFGMDPTDPVVRPLAFTIGGNLTQAGPPVPINFAAQGVTPDYHAVFCRRKDHFAAGLAYTVEFSADLGDWKPDATPPTVLTAPASPGDWEVVSVPYPSSAPTPKFFRVGVSGN